ncbi:hypothetical protein [Burkholderia metallica]|uniref:hypothetical protein n=1 Tax=Burkholderia metallica TaxID=488729 RepID=UPI001CF3024A|nr:hypothetical protein [Burkholderia metallica]MCA8000844.1 hypothetical protein [Burkholderia metallica]
MTRHYEILLFNDACTFVIVSQKEALLRVRSVGMEKNTVPTVIVTDGAAAADGGSLWIRIDVNRQARHYVLDRALASRGTPRYNTVSGEHGPLSKGERKKLLALLRSIADPAMWAGMVGTFIQVLQASDGE